MAGDEDKSVNSNSQKGSRYGSNQKGAKWEVKNGCDLTRSERSEVVEPESTCYSPCQRWRHAIFPAGIISPLRGMFRLAWAVVLANISQMWMGPISLMLVGHLGDSVQFAGAGLAISVINVSCVATAQGLGTGCDTFFSQSFGSKNKRMVGIYLQKAVYLFVFALIPWIAVYLNLGSILVLIGQNRQVSSVAGRYLMIYIPGAFCFFMYVILAKYLQNQNIVIPNVIIGFVANTLNVILHYVFLYKLHWGTDGSALSLALAHFTMFSLTIIYIWWSKVYKETWEGWSTESLQDWGKFTSTCISGMLMVSLEWWNFQIGTFLAGLLGKTELGAMSVVLEIYEMWYQLVLGMEIASAIRIGQLLGSQDECEARTVARLTIVVMEMASIIPLTLFMLLKNLLPHIITNVKEVVVLASKLLTIMSFYMLFDGLLMAGKAILCGIGRQVYALALMIVCHICIAMPIGIPLMFLTSLRTEAFWWAVVGSLVMQGCVIMFVTARIDWSLEVKKAMERAGVAGILLPKEYDTMGECDEDTTSFMETTQSALDDNPTAESPTLTTSQLIYRRGSVVLLMSLILCGGIAGNLLISVQPSKSLHSDVNVTRLITASNHALP